MNGSIIRVQTTDNIELQGIAYLPREKVRTGVLHFHGSHGNFYENHFLDVFADYYPRKGIAFVSGNNRGHDGMTVYERFEKCALDTEAWLEWFESHGIKEYILQGHSLGAHKITYYLNNHSNPRVVGCVLLSPFDLLAFYKAGSSYSRKHNVEVARKLAEEDPDILFPKKIFDVWPISAGTYLDLVGYETSADIFPFRNGDLKGSPFERLSLPIFAAIGGDDFASFPSPVECTRQLSTLASTGRDVEAHLIQNAPHDFLGHVDELTEELEDWLDKKLALGKPRSRS